MFCSNTGRIPIIYQIILKYLVPVNYTTGTPGNAVASGSSLVLPRAAVEERRRDEGTGEWAKEVARTACGEAAGAWVIGGRGGWGRAMEERV